jgi:hypothetical protein
MEYVRVPVSGGRRMHVTMLGPEDGRPAVALHGLGGSTEQNVPALDAVANYYGLRMYAIDLPAPRLHAHSAPRRARESG